MQPGYFADVRISIRFQLFKIVFFSHFSDELILMANRITAIFNWLNCRLVVYNHKTLPYLDSFFLICFTGLLIKLLRFLRRFARFSFSFQINCRFIRLQSTVSKREVFNTKRQFNELIVSSRYALFLMEILIWLVVMRGNKRCLSYVFVLSLLPLLFHSESFLEIDFIVKKCRWELIKSGTLENDLLYSEFDDDKKKKKEKLLSPNRWWWHNTNKKFFNWPWNFGSVSSSFSTFSTRIWIVYFVFMISNDNKWIEKKLKINSLNNNFVAVFYGAD